MRDQFLEQLLLADAQHAANMEIGSMALLERIKFARGETYDARKMHLRGKDLVWPYDGRVWIEPHSERNAIQANRAATKMEARESALGRAIDRDPCPRCGIRADVGCKHRRVA